MISFIRSFANAHIKRYEEQRKVSARNMFLKSKYDSVCADDRVRLEKFFKDVDAFIEHKAQMEYYSCTVDIPQDIIEHKDEIVSRYENLGFVCVDMGLVHDAFIGTLAISWKHAF